MADTVIKCSELENSIEKEIAKYSQAVKDAFYDEMDKAANEAVRRLKKNPNIPKSAKKRSKKSIGHYKNKFYLRRDFIGRSSQKWTITNRKYQLGHLLERSHKHYSHGKPTGRMTKAFPHWEQEQANIEYIVEDAKRRILNL